LVRYMTYLLSKKSLKPATVKRKIRTIRSLLNHGCDLADADNVVRFLNTCEWASGTKAIAIDSYRDYLNMLGLTEVKLPHIKREETLPFIPLESELDSLICNARTKTYAFLRVLKDTACRPIEAWVLKWMDIDLADRCVTITPAKYSHPKKLKICEQTLNLLSSLPKKNQFVFSSSRDKERFADELEHFAINFVKLRTRVADKLKNPRLNMISLKTFRHWKATIEYVRTKDILHVKEMLGHVNIANTLKYIHLANAVSTMQDDYICKVARALKECEELISSGFEYVTEFESMKLFRKRK
jgi:integrase